MLRQQLYEEALNRIHARRQQARLEQEQRTDRIREEIPETAELDRQLRNTCLAIFQAAGRENRAASLKSVEEQSRQADTMLRQLLTAHGYPADYLDLHYSCPLCDDTGYHDGKACDCLKHELGVLGAEQLNRNSQLALCRFDTFSLQYYTDPEQYRTMQKIYQSCRQYAAEFDPAASGNILMTGGTGLGKTHLSLAIASELLEQGYSVIYDAVNNLLHILNQEYFSRGNTESDTLSVLLDCDLLILDDFGTEFETQFNRSMLYTLINSRINAGKPMILNTNLSFPEEIQAHYGDRVLSRLFSATVHTFCGTDIRLMKS